jgi:hypothetical protein
MKGQIYKITFLNGKIYIGSDHQKNIDVVGKFYLGSFNEEYVYNDLLKCGWNGQKPFYVSKEIIWESNDTTKSELTKKEMLLIKQHKSNDFNIGYNRNKF